MLVMSLHYLMGKCLSQHLDLWMGSNLVHSGIGRISRDFCFGHFSIIESSGEDNSTFLDFLKFFLSCCIILTLILCREESPESMLTPCNFPVFISKLYECKQVELSANFLADFANFKSFYGTWMVLYPFCNFPYFH